MRLKYLLLAIISLGIFSSCSKEESQTYLYGGLGTAHQLGGSDFYFKFDNGETMKPIGSTFDTDVLKDSARVILTFVMEEKNVGGYTYTGQLQYLDLVLTKKALRYENEIPDTLGNGKVVVSDGYIYHKYLNLEFGVLGVDSEHEINLVMSDKDQTDDSEYVNVIFKDKVKGNAVGYGYGIVCFDISEIQQLYGSSKKGICVKATDYNTGLEREYTYDFPESDPTGGKGFRSGNVSDNIIIR